MNSIVPRPNPKPLSPFFFENFENTDLSEISKGKQVAQFVHDLKMTLNGTYYTGEMKEGIKEIIEKFSQSYFLDVDNKNKPSIAELEDIEEFVKGLISVMENVADIITKFINEY